MQYICATRDYREDVKPIKSYLLVAVLVCPRVTQFNDFFFIAHDYKYEQFRFNSTAACCVDCDGY